jgi:hypothetical protein
MRFCEICLRDLGLVLGDGSNTQEVRFAVDSPLEEGRFEPSGMVREEFIAEATGLLDDSNIHELSEERFVGTLVYPVADPAGATLTVREREADPRVTPPGLSWRLVDDRHVEITRPTAPGLDQGAMAKQTQRTTAPAVNTR